jgi:hypothetical protein
LFARQLHQLPANAALLVSLVHRQVREVAAILEIRDRPGDTDQEITIPRGAEQVGVPQHGLNDARLIDRAPFRQR